MKLFSHELLQTMFHKIKHQLLQSMAICYNQFPLKDGGLLRISYLSSIHKKVAIFEMPSEVIKSLTIGAASFGQLPIIPIWEGGG